MPSSPPAAFVQPLDLKDFKIDVKLAEQGRDLYARSCLYCHGAGTVAGGQAPDLRESSLATSRDAFTPVPIGAAKLANGMLRFKEL